MCRTVLCELEGGVVSGLNLDRTLNKDVLGMRGLLHFFPRIRRRGKY